MTGEFRGYRIEICSGKKECSNSTAAESKLIERIESLFIEEDLTGFIKQRINGEIKFHLEFRVSISECPNSCSRPQISDIGIIGAAVPYISGNTCTLCGACVDSCREKAVTLDENSRKPVLDLSSCLYCGSCVKACSSEVLTASEAGYRIQLGGRLGRHPKLAMDLGRVFTEEQVLSIIKYSLDFYKKNSTHGERFSDLLNDRELDDFRLINA